MYKFTDMVSGHRLSSVVPGSPTDENTIHELQNIDLAMKLHYLNCLYLFDQPSGDKNDDDDWFNISQLKLPMFSLLTAYCHVAGRMRRGQDGRPYVGCNDSGVRIVEAQSARSVAEVVQMNDQSVLDGLVYKMELGPHLAFSPLVILQFTWFKCGGFSVGLRWAHVLGDLFSASAFINKWARLFSTDPTASVSITGPYHNTTQLQPMTKQLRFAKRVSSVGDHWVVNPGHSNMKTHIFRVGAKQFSQIRSNACGHGAEFPPFEILSAILWKSVARIRGIDDRSCVTICRRNPGFNEDQPLSNSQFVSTAETNFSAAGAEVGHLVKLIVDAKAEEKSIEAEDWNSDFVVYGANLTFVDLREMRMYEMELRGQKPVLALCSVDGVGEDGLVLVAPDEEDGGDGRSVTVTFEEAELVELRNELKQTWNIA